MSELVYRDKYTVDLFSRIELSLAQDFIYHTMYMSAAVVCLKYYTE
jgi:hypothetical protein